MVNCEQQHKKDVEALEKDVEALEEQTKYVQFAYDCFFRCSRTGNLVMEFKKERFSLEMANLFDRAEAALSFPLDKEIFNESLTKYVLRYTKAITGLGTVALSN